MKKKKKKSFVGSLFCLLFNMIAVNNSLRVYLNYAIVCSELIPTQLTRPIANWLTATIQDAFTLSFQTWFIKKKKKKKVVLWNSSFVMGFSTAWSFEQVSFKVLFFIIFYLWF